MKKIKVFAIGIAVVSMLTIIGTSYASKDQNKLLKVNAQNHTKTLKALGISTEPSHLKNLAEVSDKNGKEFIYASFTDSDLLEQKIRDEISKDAASEFIQVQDKIMQKYAKKGDTVPILLLDETLQEGFFSFTRENGTGEQITIHLSFDPQKTKWSFEKQEPQE